MPVEIERKFLVAGGRYKAQATHATRMVQGYLGGDRASVRVRIEGDAAKLNVKAKTLGMRRAEFEYDIPLDEAEDMLRELCGERVEKLRHFVPLGDYTFEVDEFLGDNAGLVVAEIELPHEDAPFERPSWLAREVTDESRYYNVNLAREPFARWADRAAILQTIEGSTAC